MRNVFVTFLMFSALSSQAQIRNEHVYDYPERNKGYTRTNLELPEVGGYKTLTGDFHIHTVFSDGKVWPDVRVSEAWRDGLDVIAITDHLEYRPHQKTVIADMNESYKIAAKKGEELGILVIPGAEITRSKPIGHINALFINDANPLLQEDAEVAMEEARKQDAVMMFNHPGWPDNHFVMSDILRKWFGEKRFDAVEVYGWLSLYPNSIDLSLERGMAFMSNSDIHDPVADRYGLGRGARPMTILFCNEHNAAGVRDAIKTQRTIAYFNDTFAGREEWLSKFVKASLKVKAVNSGKNLYEIKNSTGLPFEIGIGNDMYVVAPFSTVRLKMKPDAVIDLKNCFVARGETLKLPATAWK